MARHKKFRERKFKTADALWDALSPTKEPFKSHSHIFRGQANSAWGLIPSVLRNYKLSFMGGINTGDKQVFYEWLLLRHFAASCDSIGLAIPNDSSSFRLEHLEDIKSIYIKSPPKWPAAEILPLMAMAQHHGVPTRLLDWTYRPYVAAYFAASSALACAENLNNERICIWALDKSKAKHYEYVRIFSAAGTTSKNLVAQSGLFTVHQHDAFRGQPFHVDALEEEFGELPDTPLTKMTIPALEAINLLDLCQNAGFSGSSIYPGPDGAGKSVIDMINYESAKRRWNIG